MIWPAAASASSGVAAELDAAAFAAAAGVDLRLDDDRHAQLLGDLAGLLGRGGDAAARHGHAVVGEELLRLVLVDLHGAPSEDRFTLVVPRA